VGERFGVMGFGDVAQADFGPRRLGRGGDALRHRGAMAGGRIVDDRKFGHDVIVGPECGPKGRLSFDDLHFQAGPGAGRRSGQPVGFAADDGDADAPMAADRLAG